MSSIHLKQSPPTVHERCISIKPERDVGLQNVLYQCRFNILYQCLLEHFVNINSHVLLGKFIIAYFLAGE